METMKIKAVVAAAEHKSFSRAAEEFSYTPSAFSHMMGGLRRRSGCGFSNAPPRGWS